MSNSIIVNKTGILPYINRDFFKSIMVIAVPVTLQTILFSSKGLIDLLMIGQLSEQDIAAVGVASRALFVATILLSGVTTGGAMLAAQYFGAKQNRDVTRSITLTWVMATLAALLPIGLFVFLGHFIIGLSSSNIDVTSLGRDYLFITSISLLAVAYSGAMAAGLRAIHQAATSTWFSGFGITLNVLFNWILIFGHFGAPALGLKGAAIGTVLSSMVEAITLWGYLRYKNHLLNFSFIDVIESLKLSHVHQFWRLSFPTTLNFLAWACGLFTYTAIMGQTGDLGLVALSVITPIEAFSLSFLVGIANATGVMVGNHLGAKNFTTAYYQAMAFVVFGFIINLLVACGLFLLKDHVISLFSALDTDSYLLAEKFYLILCVGIILRSVPTILVVGVLRAGGDVKFCLYQDMFTQWFFGIPIAAISALYFGLAAEYVYAMFFLETLFKWFACIYRFRSRRWFNHLAH